MSDMVNLFEQIIWFKLSVLLVLGLVIGSFLNVVIYRLPIILQHKWRQDSINLLELDQKLFTRKDFANKKFNLAYPASYCPNCLAKIPYWANIPLLGYFLVGRLCVTCKHKISIQYPLVELITAGLYVLSGCVATGYIQLCCYLIFSSFVVCLVFIDFNTFLLPDELTLLLLWLGLIVNINSIIAPSLSSAVIGAALGYLVLWIAYWGFLLITKKEGIGYGDFKFLAAILAWFGYEALFPILLIAPLLAIIYFMFLWLLQRIKLDQPIPFGPFLGIAALMVLFLHKVIVLNYWSHLALG